MKDQATLKSGFRAALSNDKATENSKFRQERFGFTRSLVTFPSVSQTESPAYAPASSSILFPGFWFATGRHNYLDRFARLGALRFR
jgi:hypothetical protein